jgi:hypothetical protein
VSRDPSTLQKRREDLRAKCGLDAFAQPAEVWLSIAIAAEARGEHNYARDCECAMVISNERWAA